MEILKNVKSRSNVMEFVSYTLEYQGVCVKSLLPLPLCVYPTCDIRVVTY
jgi:hypothetical protein